MTAEEISQKFAPVIETLRSVKGSWAFMRPVQELWPDVTDYAEHVRKPMDLGTILHRLQSNWYKSANDCVMDVRLTFRNAILYNGEQSDVGAIVSALEVCKNGNFND
jgi:hypothetical protein